MPRPKPVYILMLERGISKSWGSPSHLAHVMEVNHSQILRILNGTIWVSPDMAVKMESFGVITAKELMEAQLQTQLYEARIRLIRETKNNGTHLVAPSDSGEHGKQGDGFRRPQRTKERRGRTPPVHAQDEWR